MLLRFKLTQLAGVAGAAWAPFALGEALPTTVQAGLFALAGGASACTGALFFYSSRYVGELALLPHGGVLVSTFDIWGSRADVLVRRADLLPPFEHLSEAERRSAAQLVILPLTVGDRQFILSPRFGEIVDGKALYSFLCGLGDIKGDEAARSVISTALESRE
jgi:hypothetical protein